jgi:hypothetical protein
MHDETLLVSRRERAALTGPAREDFLPDGEPTSAADPESIFSDLIGCQSVLQKLREYQATIKLAQDQGKDPLKLMDLNFLFVGNPGTGKTTVARRMGKLFESLGLLSDGGNVVSCTASDFVTGYTNQVHNSSVLKLSSPSDAPLY